MNKNLLYQRFERISDNLMIKFSSRDSYSTTATPKFYESIFNYVIYELHSYTFKKLIVEKDPNTINKMTQFINDLRTRTTLNNNISIDKPISIQPTRLELSFEEIFQKRDVPMYYTINEEMLLLDFSIKDFKTWFKNEIVVLLDLIELYKEDNITYTIPNSITDIVRCPIIGGYSNQLRLENEVHSYYNRVICLYSLITTDVMENKIKRKGLFKELNFVKRLIEILTFTMDVLSIRFTYFVSELYNHYPNTSFGARSSRRLRDITCKAESEFSDLGNLVANSLINLM